MAKNENNRPEQSPVDPKKNNAEQEREYRKDKRAGKIDEETEDEDTE